MNMAVKMHKQPRVCEPPSRPAIIDAPSNVRTPGAPIPSNGGDETIRDAKPQVNASRRKNPAKAGGIDHALVATLYPCVDANSSGESREGNGAHLFGDTHQPTSPIADDQGAQLEREILNEPSPLIAEITQLVRMRRRWHKAEKSLTLQGKALCRSWTDGDKDEANAAYDRAAAGSPDDPTLASGEMHTPGPWVATDYGSVHVSVPTGENTARLVTLARGCSNANVRLIAAAPDMLAALKMVSGCDLHHDILAAVDAAISKAQASL